MKDKEVKLKLMKYEMNIKAIQEKGKLREDLGMILSKSLPKIKSEMDKSWIQKRETFQ
jgi:hypothetical protein